MNSTKVRLTVTNRPGVFNPEGKVVSNGLKLLNHSVTNVVVGRMFELTFPTNDRSKIIEEVEQICANLLVNPVIQQYTVDFLDDLQPQKTE